MESVRMTLKSEAGKDFCSRTSWLSYNILNMTESINTSRESQRNVTAKTLK